MTKHIDSEAMPNLLPIKPNLSVVVALIDILCSAIFKSKIFFH